MADHISTANSLSRIAHTRADRLSALELQVIDSAVAALRAEGASRQALDEQQDGQARQAGDRVKQLGAAVSVRQLTPASAGHAVRLLVDPGPLWLEPADAHAIADALNAAALEAIHADRAGRHRG